MFEIINTFKAFRKLRTDEHGVTALEYGLIAAVIGTAVVAVGPQVTTILNAVFTKLATTAAAT